MFPALDQVSQCLVPTDLGGGGGQSLSGKPYRKCRSSVSRLLPWLAQRILGTCLVPFAGRLPIVTPKPGRVDLHSVRRGNISLSGSTDHP